MKTNTSRSNITLTARDIRRRKIMARRARQLRIRLTIAISVFIIVLFSAIGMTSFMSKAQETSEEYHTKCYTSVMVPYGTTLSELSIEYINSDYYDSLDSYMNEVMFINHMISTDIKAGTYLIMPYYS